MFPWGPWALGLCDGEGEFVGKRATLPGWRLLLHPVALRVVNLGAAESWKGEKTDRPGVRAEQFRPVSAHRVYILVRTSPRWSRLRPSAALENSTAVVDSTAPEFSHRTVFSECQRGPGFGTPSLCNRPDCSPLLLRRAYYCTCFSPLAGSCLVSLERAASIHTLRIFSGPEHQEIDCL